MTIAATPGTRSRPEHPSNAEPASHPEHPIDLSAIDAVLLVPPQREATTLPGTPSLPHSPDTAAGRLNGIRAAAAVAAGAVLLGCGLAALSDPALAPGCLLVTLLVCLTAGLLRAPRIEAALTWTALASVAVPPVLRALWWAAGLPQLMTQALIAGQISPLSEPMPGAGPISPLPAVSGPLGLGLAVLAVAVTASLARVLAGRLSSGPLPLPRGAWLRPHPAASATGAETVAAAPGPIPARPLPPTPPGEPAARTSPAGLVPDLSSLLQHAGDALDAVASTGHRLTLFVLQVDRFDALAAALGPAPTDDLVRQVARRLRAWLPADDVVARLGRGTFAVLVENGDGELGATSDRMARRMSALLHEPLTCAGRTLSITVSIGIAAAHEQLESAQALLGEAFDALEMAQRRGSARWEVVDGAQRSAARSQGNLELDLRRALQEQRIGAAFQPIVQLADTDDGDRVIAMEAVARWDTPGHNASPSTLVAAAEAAGLGSALGWQVLQCGLDAVAAWYGEHHEVGRLAVTLTQTPLDDAQLVPTVLSHLERRHLLPECLMVEIGAATFTAGATAVANLTRLHELGVEVWLADFGVPGVSLAALGSLPLSGVKVDRSVTTTLHSPLPVAAVALCRSLGLRCLLEGIQTPQELDLARALGVDAVQGSLLGRPARAREVSSRLSALRAG